VRAAVVVVIEELPQYSREVALSEDDQEVETFGPDGFH
jgi:hypothetical protein